MITVKWHEFRHVEYAGQEDYIRMDYKGQVIGTEQSFLRGSVLFVACEDGKVRVVSTSEVTICSR